MRGPGWIDKLVGVPVCVRFREVARWWFTWKTLLVYVAYHNQHDNHNHYYNNSCLEECVMMVDVMLCWVTDIMQLYWPIRSAAAIDADMITPMLAPLAVSLVGIVVALGAAHTHTHTRGRRLLSKVTLTLICIHLHGTKHSRSVDRSGHGRQLVAPDSNW